MASASADEGKEFSRLEYRRVDAWPARLRREGPFLAARLAEAPTRGWIVDLGCGSGEHARFLAGEGHATIGIDRSADALALAGGAPGAAWLRADISALPLAAECARLALCLGNTLALLGEDAVILAALREAHRVLRPGGLLVIQVLNYHRLRGQAIRTLPVNFRRDEESGEELVYLRLMDFDEPAHVAFHVITLAREPGTENVEVRRSVRRRLRSLEYGDLDRLLEEAGFHDVSLAGDYAGAAFEPDTSSDVIAVARA